MSYDGSSRVEIETPESDLSKNIYDEEIRAEFESEIEESDGRSSSDDSFTGFIHVFKDY